MNEHKNFDKNFIVPIYENGIDFNGSGFLIGDYLISAAHVFEEGKKYSYIFKNEIYDLTKTNFIREYERGCNPHLDLQIFKVGNHGSPYVFFEGKYVDGQHVYLHGYSFDEKERKVIIDEHDVTIYVRSYSYFSEKPLRLDNCISYEEAVGKKGNSGCPLIENNIIYGMNVGEAGFNEKYVMGRAICSTYILEQIVNL